ncbi:MAG: Hpt domain-containing protein, partial [Cyanobacteria bacterium J06648_11]
LAKAHQLKGASGNIGAWEVHHLSQRLEEYVEQETPERLSVDSLQELNEAIAKVKAFSQTLE